MEQVMDHQYDVVIVGAGLAGLRAAIELGEKAIDLSLAGNDDAILRWNACARILMRNPEVSPASKESG